MVSSAYCGVFRVCEPHRRERCRILVHCPNKLNVDGRVDLFIGPEAPKGMESNWIPRRANVRSRKRSSNGSTLKAGVTVSPTL